MIQPIQTNPTAQRLVRLYLVVAMVVVVGNPMVWANENMPDKSPPVDAQEEQPSGLSPEHGRRAERAKRVEGRRDPWAELDPWNQWRSGGSTYWQLIYYEAFRAATDARNRERALKKYGQTRTHLKHRLQNSLRDAN